MPTFRYVAKDKMGRIHRGNAEAADERSLQKQLQDSGYWLTQASVVLSGDASNDHLANSSEDKAKQVYIVISLVIMALVLWFFMR